MHGTPTSSRFHVFRRDDGGNSGGLSTNTIIIIAVVCGCVVILALALFLWRLLARCCRPQASVPLPPVQDLAHHRRDQQRAFANTLNAASRPGTWVDASASARTLQSGSAVSLLTNPEKVPSIYTDEMTTAESTLPSPDGDVRLYPPNPSFYRNSDASSSRNTLADNASSSHNSLVSPPIPESSSATSHASRPQSSQSRPPSSRSRSRVPSRGRPLSQVSDSPTSHSGFTMRSGSVLRGGPPHRSGSMQIVLPAPLGPQSVYAPGDQPTLYANAQTSRSSVFADPWLTHGNVTRNSTVDLTADGRRPANSRSRSRHKQTSSVPPPQPSAPPPPPAFRRAASQQRPQTRSPETSPPPRVPQAPYANLADLAESNYDDAARGRPRTTSNRLTRIPSGQVP